MSPEALSFMPKFFVIGGLILVLSGAAQWFIRPRRENETPAQMLGSRATLKMFRILALARPLCRAISGGRNWWRVTLNAVAGMSRILSFIMLMVCSNWR